MQQVEGEERRRPSRVPVEAARQLDRIRPTRRIDDDELPVEDRRAGSDPHRETGEFRQRRRDVPSTCVPDDRHRRSRATSAGPIETSARSPPHHGSKRCSSESNGAGQRAREHRPQVGEIGQLVGLEAQRELVGHRRSMVAR